MRLQPKILLIFSALAFLLGLPLLMTVKSAEHRILLNDVKQRGLMSASDLADDMAHDFEKRNEQLILPLLQSTQGRVGAVYVAALDPSGVVLAHTNVAEKGQMYTDAVTLQGLWSVTPIIRPIDFKGAPILHISVPVWAVQKGSTAEEFLLGGVHESHAKTRLGTVCLGIPLKEVLKTESYLFKKVAAIVLSVGTIGFLLIIGLMRHMLLPIQFLSAGTARISRGEYGVKVPISSNDELGQLAGDFNRMSQFLSETTVSKDFLGNILSHMIDPLIVTTMEGEIQMVNQATLDLLGYAKGELEGQPAHALFIAKAQATQSIKQETLILKESVRNIELEFLKKSGEKVSVLFSSSVMKNAKGEPAGVIAVAKDVTERKRLESVVRQSDKMSAVGQLAAGVAHEINNPLGVILGFAQAALRRITPGEALEMPLKSIEREAVRCKDLVQNLLTFSRVSKVDREPIDLNKTVEGALSLINARARTANIEVRREMASDLPRFLGNPNQVQQIVVNLANNAFDAMGDRGILTVRTALIKGDPLSWIVLSMGDTGTGIAPEVLSRIFEPFFTTKPVGKGTGLGLSLIHEMVKKHSGTIDVKSQPGSTEFFIKFPVRLIPAESAEEAVVPHEK